MPERHKYSTVSLAAIEPIVLAPQVELAKPKSDKQSSVTRPWCHRRTGKVLTTLVVAGLVLAITGIIILKIHRHTSKETDISLDTCSSSPCGPNNTCIVRGIESFTCLCGKDLTGTTCDATYADSIRPTIYFLEHSLFHSGEFITKLTADGLQTRVASGGTGYALALDVNTSSVYYTTCDPPAIWRADLADISSTTTIIYHTTKCSRGLALSIQDQLIFADQFNAGLIMLDYRVTMVHTLVVNKSDSYGLAVDEAARLLYFTDSFNYKIWVASYSPTGFIGSPSEILSGEGEYSVGHYPTGLLYEDGTLYWIGWDRKIRSMSVDDVTGMSASRIVAENLDGYNQCYISKRRDTFYYTETAWGVYEVTAGERATRIATATRDLHGIVVI